MNLVRQVLERMYEGECTITEHLEYDKPNGGTGFREVTVLMKEPCRLSFQSKEAANAGERASGITQTIKLFLRPDGAGERRFEDHSHPEWCYCRLYQVRCPGSI